MKNEVKEKDCNGAGEEQPQKDVGIEEDQAMKKFPKRGKRYSRAQKDEILNFLSTTNTKNHGYRQIPNTATSCGQTILRMGGDYTISNEDI